MEKGILEAEIAELSKKIEEKRRALEGASGIQMESREVVHEVIRDELGPVKEAVIDLANQNVQPSTASKGTSGYLDALEPETVERVNTLIEIVSSKGIREAISAAKNESPRVLDAFHDALTTRLYNELRRTGAIE